MSSEASLPAASALAERTRRELSGHIPALDGLRAIAILMVLAHNVGSEQPHTRALWYEALMHMHAPGWAGVQLFFVLSGFLITGILLDTRGDTGAFRSFIIRRALRIFPLYYAVLLVGVLAIPRLFPSTHLADTFRYQGWYWSYLSNWVAPFEREIAPFAHFWSLAVEEQFYLVWPVLALLLSPRALLRLSLALAVVALLFRIGVHRLHAPPLVAYQWTIARLDALVLGAAAAIVLRKGGAQNFAPKLRIGLVVVLGALAALWPFSHGLHRDDVLTQTAGYTLLAIACTQLIALVVLDREGKLARALASPKLRFIGKYSYGIYVLHMPIYYLLKGRFRPMIASESVGRSVTGLLLLGLTVVVLSVVAALCSWHLLEKHFLALKDVLAPRPAKRATATPPA